jgi:chemotaxis protein MotB
VARKKKHEEHVNAEAWAIPYGDLVTLLLALFVVLYSMSSVNEGKYRVLSDSLVAAFRGTPKTVSPINVGSKAAGKGGDKQMTGVSPTVLMKLPKSSEKAKPAPPAGGTSAQSSMLLQQPGAGAGGADVAGNMPAALVRMEREVRDAMKSLIDAKLITLRQDKTWLEVEINTDILFPSGSSGFVGQATPVIDKLAAILRPFPNPIRVEGHTDDRPIHTKAFPSNWELSPARAASIVHHFTEQGVDPKHMEIVGLGQYRPRSANKGEDGRNANRRVVIVILQAATPGDVLTAQRDAHSDSVTRIGEHDIADGSSGANRLLLRADPNDLAAAPASKEQTVLARPPHSAAAPVVAAGEERR